MRGLIPLESVYGERLEVIRPSRAEIDALGTAYTRSTWRRTRAPRSIGCAARGSKVVLVSGGLRQAIEPLAKLIGRRCR